MNSIPPTDQPLADHFAKWMRDPRGLGFEPETWLIERLRFSVGYDTDARLREIAVALLAAYDTVNAERRGTPVGGGS